MTIVSLSVVFFFLFSFVTFLYQLSLIHFSYCFCSAAFSHYLQVSLNVILPSQSPFSSLHVSSTLLVSALCQCSICRSFHMTDPFQPTPHIFLLKTFLQSNLHFQLSILLLSALLTSTILLTSCFRKPAPSPVVFLLVPLWPYMFAVVVGPESAGP